MTNFPLSSSDGADAYDSFHPEVRRWIRDQGWAALRDVQQRAARAILGSSRDVLISAATAAGKTEAAFLPLLGPATERTTDGVAILYVAPLKALINDQHYRLSGLCERLGMPLVRWHGDAPRGPKDGLIRRPRGVVLITPESMEAMIVRRPALMEALFGSVDAIVIDELHAFLQGPRGLHLWSLLNRLDALCEARPRRIALSATIGDLSEAGKWLSATAATAPLIVADEAAPAQIQVQVRAYVEPPPAPRTSDLMGEADDSAIAHIATHAVKNLRGRNNLFFAGSRANVEDLADRTRRICESSHVPNEFFPHHGSLSRDLREQLESRLKLGLLPTTAIATTTLELGIDIGSVHSVGQMGAPRSLSSLRQRLGRSGRRQGSSAIFRNYVRSPWIGAESDPLDTLQLQVVQSVAAMRLLAARFVEPARPDRALLSVTVHQMLSHITQKGGCRAADIYEALCTKGPYAQISKGDFVKLLRGLGNPEQPLLEQAADGTLLLGEEGERIVSGRDFFANFEVPEEWRLVNAGRSLGSLPIVNALVTGSIIGFAGRRWRVSAVDDHAKVVEVLAHSAGRIPKFDRIGSEPIHDRLAAEMHAVLLGTDDPGYLDAEASKLLIEGRKALARNDDAVLLAAGPDTHFLTWKGSETNALLAVLLTSTGLECETFDVGVTLIGERYDEAYDLLSTIKQCPPVADLAHYVTNLECEKYDPYVPKTLLRQHWHIRNAHLADAVSAVLHNVAGTARRRLG